MKKYEINNKDVFFHEEAHIYFGSEKDMEAFSKSYNKNKDWALRNKSRWNPVMSITQYLSNAFPFSGGDLKITKAWFKKEALYNKEDEKWIEENINKMSFVEEYLSKSVERSQDEGNVGHELVQDFIEGYIKTGKALIKKSDNPYWKEFLKELKKENSELSTFIKNIEVVLPSEIPVVGTIEGTNVTYAGKWDLLVQMKDKRIILIDIKTGSKLKDDKDVKVGLQLNAYSNLIKQSLEVDVDELICWELSYDLPFRDAESKFKAEKRKVEKSKLEGKEVALDRLKMLQEDYERLSVDKGLREYYFKEHKYKNNDSYKDIMVGVDTILKSKSLAKDNKEKK